MCETLLSENKRLAINYKVYSVAAYLRYGGVVNNQIKKGSLLSLSVKFFLISYLAKLQARTWLSHAFFFVFQQCDGQPHKMHETTTFLLVDMTAYFHIFSRRTLHRSVQLCDRL